MKVYVILETLSNSYKMIKGILKYYKGVHLEVKGSSCSSTKKKKQRITLNKKKFKRGNKKSKLKGK